MHIGEPCVLVRSSIINKMFHLPTPLRAQKSSRKDPRGVAHSFLGLLLCFVAGCAQQPLHLNTRQQGVRNALAQVDPYHDELPRLTRIIDIHTHTFNARYLPLEGIFLGKRDVSPVASWLSDDCARTLASALVDRTELDAVGDEPAVVRPRGKRFLKAEGNWVCRVIIGLLNKAEKNGSWDHSLPEEEQLKRVQEVAYEMSFTERAAVRAMADMMGMEKHVQGKGIDGLVATVRFIWQATQKDSGEMAFFRRDYQPAPMLGSPLMISHMMDLGPVYNQKPKGESFLDFSLSQVRRMQEYQNRPSSGMIYFVAYNPYREYWNGESPGESLRLVRKAIEQEGAWGVKFYPPSGYRPAGNKIKDPPNAKKRYPYEQWNARYGPLGTERDVKLDKIVDELLTWCTQHDVPIFVHCSTGEFEAQKGYGAYESDPEYWAKALEKHPDLRLCLGHAGGGDYWFGGTQYQSWGKKVASLCRKYPKVFCEVTTHSEMTKPDRQAWFADRLIEEFKNDPPVEGPETGYKFSRKLLYGTDWYLPDAAVRSEVLAKTEQVFLHPSLKEHYEDYFCGNAARYLNVAAKLPHLNSSAVKARLRPFDKY